MCARKRCETRFLLAFRCRCDWHGPAPPNGCRAQTRRRSRGLDVGGRPWHVWCSIIRIWARKCSLGPWTRADPRRRPKQGVELGAICLKPALGLIPGVASRSCPDRVGPASVPAPSQKPQFLGRIPPAVARPMHWSFGTCQTLVRTWAYAWALRAWMSASSRQSARRGELRNGTLLLSRPRSLEWR